MSSMPVSYPLYNAHKSGPEIEGTAKGLKEAQNRGRLESKRRSASQSKYTAAARDESRKHYDLIVPLSVTASSSIRQEEAVDQSGTKKNIVSGFAMHLLRPCWGATTSISTRQSVSASVRCRLRHKDIEQTPYR